MRLFIAIPLSHEVKEYLAEIKLQARIVKDFHLTLKFLGEVPDIKAEKIINALNKVRIEPFKFSLSGIGFFPNERYIRVVWVGVNPKKHIIDFQKKIDEKLKLLGYRKEKKFHPHITIARVKHLEDKEKFLKNLKEIKIKPIEISVNGFELIKSTLTQKGPIYEIVQTFINESSNP